MSPKLIRLLAIGALAAGFGIVPMPGAWAGTDRGVPVNDMPTGFQQDPNGTGQCHSTSDYRQMPLTEIDPGDTVKWYMASENQAKHNITPVNDVPGGQHWPAGVQKSEDLAAGADPVSVSFTKATPGYYFYYSSANAEGTDKKGVLDGMCGVIHVRGATPVTTDTTTPATEPAPTPGTTAPPAPEPTPTTAPVTASPSANHPGTLTAPAPTTTTAAKAEKDHKPKDQTTTTTTAPPVNGPVDLPAEAIVPDVNPTGTATQNGVVQPSSTPTGDATALIKEKHGTKGVKLLVVTGVGIGALGVGAGVYKYANRSSKYFPA